MSRLTESKDVKLRARRAYDAMRVIWPETDKWSSHTAQYVEDVVTEIVRSESRALLNAGCGQNDFGFSQRASTCVNLDISFQQCRGMKGAIVADLEAMPFSDSSFHIVLCVGAVINYCEPYVAIPEIFRVLKRGGYALIDFETTQSAELLFSPHWGKRVSVIERHYAGRLDKTLLFSPEHIGRIIGEHGVVTRIMRYHTATAAWARFVQTGEIPKTILAIDRLLSRIPVVNSLASNAIFVCQKR